LTQRQLHAHLQTHAPALGFNVTGSAADSSILGNALDRGVGYVGPRFDDVFALEVVLGTGEVLRTGFRRLGEGSPLAHSHPHGLGPVADGLFFQGNFGIVTSACFRLLHRRPVELALALGLRDARRLGEFLDVLVDLKRDGLLSSVTHVGNAERAAATLRAGLTRYLVDRCALRGDTLEAEVSAALRALTATPWTGLAGLSGNRGQARAALAEVKGRLRGLANVRTFDIAVLEWGARWADRLRALPVVRRYAAALSAAIPLQRLALGVPTDVAFDNLLWMYGQPELHATEYARSRCGVLFVSPALPVDGPVVQQLVAGLKRIAEQHGHVLYITLNIETAYSLVGVINLLFDRSDPADTARAQTCAAAMLAHIHDEGLEVYRARTDQMDAVVARTPEHWAMLDRLRKAWDPDGVIAPGRYAVRR
jgi:4-cresol dehydrogenase (hydroxylating)